MSLETSVGMGVMSLFSVKKKKRKNHTYIQIDRMFA